MFADPALFIIIAQRAPKTVTYQSLRSEKNSEVNPRPHSSKPRENFILEFQTWTSHKLDDRIIAICFLI